MKKFLSIILSSVMVFSLSATAFAAENEPKTYQTKDGLKAETAISEEALQSLPESMKEELLNDDCTIVSISETYVDLETNTATKAVMPTSDFKLTTTAARLEDWEAKYDGHEGKDCFKFITTGEWIVNPNFEFTDCIGLTWSDEFTLYEDDGYTYSYGGYKDRSTMTLNDMVPEQGFAYDADLRLFDRQNEITIVGKVYKDDDSGSANVCGSYGHVIITPSAVDVSFSSGKEISFGVSWNSGIETASPDYDSFNY
jgi:hypothetical protein